MSNRATIASPRIVERMSRPPAPATAPDSTGTASGPRRRWRASSSTGPNQVPLAPPAPLWRRPAARLTDVLIVFFLVWAMMILQILWFLRDLSQSIRPGPWGPAFVPTVTFGL